jgi:hypothetical protein
MKYAFRRLLLGVVIVPLVAVVYFVFYAVLVGGGAEPTSTPIEVWNNGLMFGVGATLVFAVSAVIE